jgi:hypothetical protein
MAVATSTIVAAAVVAAAAGAAAYMQSEAAAEQADAQKKAARLQAEAEQAAGAARRKQVEAKYARFREGQRSRAAAAGVALESASLLESQQESAALAEYEAQLAEYPHAIAAQQQSFQSKLFGYQRGKIKSQQIAGTALAAGTSLASSYGSYVRRQPPPQRPESDLYF